VYALRQPDGRVDEIPLRRAMNALLRDSYSQDCERGLARWNKELEKRDIDDRLYLPVVYFNRKVGEFAGVPSDPRGQLLNGQEYERQRSEWLPTEDDRARVGQLLRPMLESGKLAGWIAPPARGINGQPLTFEYVIFD
jgi:benzoyl-CoA 2,3-epoxidase subunit B